MTTTRTPGYNCRLAIFFATTETGRKVAYYWSVPGMRAVRMSLADAEVFVAAEQADLLPGHPMRPAR